MQSFNVSLFVLLALGSFINCEILRPRGVAISQVALYPPDKNFVCFDGSLSIPFNWVNDDFCDCRDGSDEPGTSACPSGTFYCPNVGYKPTVITSSLVNDGICDCCDGSDEYNSTAACQNNCNELGHTMKVEQQKKQELLKSGNIKRQEMIHHSGQLREEKESKLEKLRNERAEAEKIAHDKDELKKKLEDREKELLSHYEELDRQKREEQERVERELTQKEATQVFLKYDADVNGKVSRQELQKVPTFDQNKDGTVSDEEAGYYMNGHDELELEDFITSSWPLIKSQLLAESEKTEEAKSAPDETQPIQDEHDEEEEKEEGFEGEYETAHQYDDYGDAERAPKHSEPEHGVGESAETKHDSRYDDDTQIAIDEATQAREEHSRATQRVQDIDREITKLEEDLKRDYGPDNEYLSITDECFTYTDREYVYKLCMFNHVTQQPRSGGSETRLGVWGKWGNDRYDQQIYDHGTACWNGPQRSTVVNIECGLETKITSVSEPNRCEYLLQMQTPVLCKFTNEQLNGDEHDEL